MPPNEAATDASPTMAYTVTTDGLGLPSRLFERKPADLGCSQAVWDETDSYRCV